MRGGLMRFLAAFGILAGAAIVLLMQGREPARGTQGATGLLAIRVPEGFQVEKVAGAGLVTYPMLGTLDDRGRLFLCESSGHTLTTKQMAARPDYRIRLLEDLDGDGVYDRSKVFADKLTLPAGAVWYRGSLYVAAPPDLLRFDDTNNDGVADRREVILTGWNLSANAASLHGPFFGPDGWLYLTDGRHGYNIKTKEGTTLTGKASRIWRCRPDGTGLEWFAGGGFDNPVEVVFTPAGEVIGTMTYFTDPKDGQRDALLHFVEGGVYPKPHPTAAEFKRTGDWMPVMTKFARIAPSGLLRYRSATFGDEHQGNLFSAHFNSHRVQRHALFREGATFRTEDEDFLTSTDPDFHPTDVMEDADGNLLVVDTGGWFIHGCPISRISKPEVRGGIYRVRKVGAVPAQEGPGDLEDPRPSIRDQALERLVAAGEASVENLIAVREKSSLVEARAAAVFGLSRIGTEKAQQGVRAALDDPDFTVRIAAARAVGMAKDRAALNRLVEMVRKDELPARRQAATALGQIGDKTAVRPLLAAAAGVEDRFVEHAIIYSLIQLGEPATVTEGLRHPAAEVRKAALIALDQMDGAPLRPSHVAPFLSDARLDLRRAALWVVSHHPDWSGEVLAFLRARLRVRELPTDEADTVREALVTFCGDAAAQGLVAELLGESSLGAERQVFLLDTISRCSLKQLPTAWIQRIGDLLDGGETSVRVRAISLIRSRGIEGLDDRLEKMAGDPSTPEDLRTAALGALVARRPKLEGADFQFLVARLESSADAVVRQSAAQALGRAEMADEQLLALARGYMARADPLLLPSLLEAFRHAKSQEVGRALVAVLLQNPAAAASVGIDRLRQLLRNFPPNVQAAARPVFARFRIEQSARIERLRKLEPLLTAGGDIGRGRQVFFGAKVACSSCHTIGTEGGHVGPDLTAIGAIRSGHDLLEAIVFPSASFVPGHEVYRVETATDVLSGVLGSRGAEAVVLITGPNGEVRIPRDKIVSMKPSTVSLMPEGLDESLTQSEFTDLLAFLQSQKSRESAQQMAAGGGR